MEFGKVIHTFKSSKGNTIEFRYPSQDEFAPLYKFACDLSIEDTFIELSGPPPSKDEERKWYGDMLTSVAGGTAIYVHAYVNNVFIGNGRVMKGKFRHSHVGHLGISLIPEYRDEGIGSELMKVLIQEARTSGLVLLELSCYENNPRALHVYEKLGFQRIGVLPNGVAWKGGYVGEVKMYLTL